MLSNSHLECAIHVATSGDQLRIAVDSLRRPASVVDFWLAAMLSLNTLAARAQGSGCYVTFRSRREFPANVHENGRA